MLVCVPSVRAETEIDTFPYMITASGEYYLGAAYASATSGTQALITIDADNVVLDGRNWPITWNDVDQIVIYVHSANNVEIKNMNIINAAVQGSGGGDWRAIQIRAMIPALSGITIRDSYFSGGGYTTIVDYGVNTSVINCTIENGYNGYRNGANGVHEVSNAVIRDCAFNDMHGDVFLWDSGAAYAPNVILDNVNVTNNDDFVTPVGFVIPNNATVTNCNVFGGVMGFSFATDAGQTSVLRSSNVYGSLELGALEFCSTFGGTAIIDNCFLQNLGTSAVSSLLRYDGSLGSSAITLVNNTLEGANYFSMTVLVGSSEVGTQTMYNNFVNFSALGVLPSPTVDLLFNDSVCGNFWAHPDGTGWSQVNADMDMDGIIDVPYVIGITTSGNYTDYLPLSVYPFGAQPPTPPTPTPTPTPPPTVPPTSPPGSGGGGGGWLPSPSPTSPAGSAPTSPPTWLGVYGSTWLVILLVVLLLVVVCAVALWSSRR